jgi:ABC-type transport system involved in cytochrome c biogenesis permease subunit
MENILLLITTSIYGISFVTGLFRQRQISLYAVYLGMTAHLVLLITRCILAQYPPFMSLYEGLILISFLLNIKFLFFTRSVDMRIIHFHRAMTFILLLFIILIPADIREIRSVLPLMNNLWMYVHAPAALFAYTFLLSGLIYALINLISKKNIYPYDKQMDKDIGPALLLLCVALITSAFRSQLSLGNYWSWNPNETWTLINIIILSFYFYKKDRLLQSLIVIITVLSVLFTHIGLNLIALG